MAFQIVDDQTSASGTADATLTAPQEFRAHWRVVAASFVGLMFGAWALPIYLLGPFMKSFETSLGWHRADLVYCTTFLAIGGTLGNPIVGRIVDRYSPLPVALACQLVIAVCFGAFSLVEGGVLNLQLLYFAMGFFGAGSGGVPFTRAIGAWFHKGRGFALGIALCGTAAAAFAAPLMAQGFIEQVGWRTACLCIAALTIIVPMPIVAWGLRTPAASELSPGEPGPDLHGVTRAEAMRDPRFYVLAVSIGLFGTFISSIVVNNVPMLIDKGLEPAHAARIASLMGIAMMVGRLIIGWVLDRLPPALVGASIFILGACGTSIFVIGGTPFAALMVVATGFLLGAEVDLLSYMALRYFGPRHYGEIFGLLFASYTLFSMVGPAVNKALLAAGGYDAMFIGTTIGFLTSGLMLLGLAFFRRAESRVH
jgi:predicted MFS family arabinose efflux permease